LHYAGDTPVDVGWRIEAGAASERTAIWTTPTNLIVRTGLQIDVGSGKMIAVPFDSCAPRFCEVRAKLAPDFIAILRQAPKLAAGVTFRNNKTFAFQFSPKGFAQAFDQLDKAPTAGNASGG
jgi:invasion protein IalB